ncbi:MAG: S1C family serine protease [Bacillota bacterium]
MSSTVRNFLLIGGAVLVAAVGGAYVERSFGPGGEKEGGPNPRRPIIQIVRGQAGLPSVADAVATLCPSIAAIAPAGASAPVVTGFAVSPDGWVLTSTAALPKGDLEVRFGSGPAVGVSDSRSDAVSGLTILKTGATGLTPVPLADQSFPRVGDFAFAIDDPAGSGCSAEAAMIASDFLTDGGAPNAYVRVEPMGADLGPGVPLISGGGQAIGVIVPGRQPNSAIAADMVADIADELLRSSLSPTTHFGFRAEDFDASLSSRLSASRSSGTAVALVQPKSPAARAGLQAGDVVVAVNGSPVASASELGRALDGAGKSVSLDVARGDQRLTITVGRLRGS